MSPTTKRVDQSFNRERLRLFDDLIGAGLVRRVGNPDDRRSVYAVIANDGILKFKAASPTYLAAIETHFAAGLTAQQLEALEHSLLRVKSRLSR